jgi:hypothetical protein
MRDFAGWSYYSFSENWGARRTMPRCIGYSSRAHAPLAVNLPKENRSQLLISEP